MNHRRLLAQIQVILLASLAAALPGCRSGESPTTEDGGAGEENIIQEVKERGPVKVTLRVEPKEPTFADRVHFTIEAVSEKGIEVKMPSPGENLGAFLIKDFDSPPEKVTADGTTYRQSYVLEFLTSGEYKIPPLTISFRDRKSGAPEPSGGDDNKKEGGTEKTGGGETPEKLESAGKEAEIPEYKILTDEITIHVKPIADPESLKDLAPIDGQAQPPPLPASVTWPLAILGGLAGAVLLVYLLVRFIRRERPPPPPVPAHEIAYRELEWLLAQGYTGRGELKEFFFHLSRILREYIENRFGLRAPELTTEEFLEELARKPGGQGPAGGEIPLEHQRLLREFLERADMVKFAKYLPDQKEIEASFEAAKRFIEATLKTERPRAGEAAEEVAHAGH